MPEEEGEVGDGVDAAGALVDGVTACVLEVVGDGTVVLDVPDPELEDDPEMVASQQEVYGVVSGLNTQYHIKVHVDPA